MALQFFYQDDETVFDLAARSLGRNYREARHNGLGRHPTPCLRGFIADPWRFPFITRMPENNACNTVTFVYCVFEGPLPEQIALIGSFAPPFVRTPLQRVGRSPWFTVSLNLPKGVHHHYLYEVDGLLTHDLINPQDVVLANGQRWSRFITEDVPTCLALEPWEALLITRLAQEIVPFPLETEDGLTGLGTLANAIDKLLAREELHRLKDYQSCLDQILNLLQHRFPGLALAELNQRAFAEIFGQMEMNSVPGWSHQHYEHPRFFIKLLRRHVAMVAFGHMQTLLPSSQTWLTQTFPNIKGPWAASNSPESSLATTPGGI